MTPHASPRQFLGAELRCWREQWGLSLAELAGRVFVSPDMLRKVEKAQRTATPDLLNACDAVLDTGGAFGRLLAYAEHASAPAAALPFAPGAAGRPAGVCPAVHYRQSCGGAGPVRGSGGGEGGARLYSLGERRRRRDGG
ncbi:helix-turn-helix domain-containing protein [Dactylosporangium matsuzakiense]|uniref:helix-turn-helix domain-containing protein n=1 Tax=Dactylosporangium matsuzakiense TaxID=53360 RepID=UPI0022F2A621|nr:helix-turn-helix transcriptional regulator [Dactylosporangium matsuzakiense]